MNTIESTAGVDAIAKQHSHEVDKLEVAMQSAVKSGAAPLADMPLVHRFTPGIYTRQITMPAGSLVISRIHKTEHPYVVVKGKCRVWTETDGIIEIVAPHVGITKPGTRRVIRVLEDTVWMTFHATDCTDPDEIVKAVTESHDPMESLAEGEAKHLLEGFTI